MRSSSRAPWRLTSQLCTIDIKGERKDQCMRLPKPESSVTQHRFGVGGKSFDYTATAGTLIIRDEQNRAPTEL